MPRKPKTDEIIGSVWKHPETGELRMPLVNQDVPQCGMDGIMYAAVRRGQSRIGTDSRDEWWAWRTCAIRVDMSESGAESDGEPDGVGVSLPSRGMFEMMYEWLIGGDRR